ncbi:hypothetical protein MRX96_027266 [Rhipicephalus microplus]
MEKTVNENCSPDDASMTDSRVMGSGPNSIPAIASYILLVFSLASLVALCVTLSIFTYINNKTDDVEALSPASSGNNTSIVLSHF